MISFSPEPYPISPIGLEGMLVVEGLMQIIGAANDFEINIQKFPNTTPVLYLPLKMPAPQV